uniref:ATPase, vacuolar ER assembly factor, Vma12 n=1 Tax=Kalanchoe fedtschenkoi TaxID=63787 RepID=A0A7N0U0N0_KALFE
MAGDAPTLQSGLALTNTDSIRSFLASASSDPSLSEDLQRTASQLSSQPSVSYRSIRDLWSASSPESRPDIGRLVDGSVLVFNSPKRREKSEELQERLRKLADMEERKAYRELVKDITPKKDPEPFSTYKDQLGFGLHVALTMFTGYLVGYAAFRALFDRSTVMNAAGGILGLVCGMLVETLIFIIRASKEDLKSSPSVSNQKKGQ